jgi:putative DNA primase/helicase
MSLHSEAWIAGARSVHIEDELARRGIKLRGNKVERCGPCPKCGGDDRFSINTAKQVFNCRGCKVGGDVIDLVRFLDGVEFTEACTKLAGEPAKPNKPNGKDHTAQAAHEVCVGTFSYTDESGALLFMVGRIQYRKPDGSFVLKDGKPKKTFRQKRPDPARPGQWIHNVDSVRIVPYKLPELIEAVGNGHFVVMVEGEAKVDFLHLWNVPATCNAMGAGKWKPAHAEFLRGADVIILPDNDEPGRDHADAVGASLQEIAKSVRVLELPELEPKQDIIDWAKQGGTVEQLHDLIAREARPWAPRKSDNKQQDHSARADTEQQHAGQATDTASLASARASTFEMEAFDWLWENRFALGKLSLIVGLPDEGKGQFLSYLAAQITTGGLWPCNEGRSPLGNVLMFTDEDDPHDTVVPRLAAAGADLDRVEIVRMVRDNNKDRIFSLLTDLELLRRKIIEVGDIKLVQIDPISAYLGIGKIDSFRTTDVRAVLAPLVNLAAELHVAIIAVMHFNKKLDVTNALLRISDSLAFGAVARGVYAIIDDAEHERKLVVRAKNNIAAKTAKTLAFRFTAREVGIDKKSSKAIWAPYIVFDPQYVDVSASEAMQAAADNKSPGARDAAKKLLREMLANGPALLTEIEEAADANGIASRTLFRAKGELGIIAKKSHSNNGPWTWELPAAGPKPYWADKD